jgi:diaminopimelate decarboxylase
MPAAEMVILKWMSAGRPPAFTYKRNELQAEGIPISRLADLYGTPLYIYSEKAIRERFTAFRRAFRSVPHTICYSVKANPNVSLLKLLWKLGAGFDIVSGGELERVLHVSKRAARTVVFSGVGKSAAEMDAALKAGILIFNVESEDELALLAARSRHLRKVANVAVRVNPDVPAETHPYISTGLHEHKFGVAMEDARRLYALAARETSLRTAGASVHIGSQITDAEPFAAAVTRVVELIDALRRDGHEIRYIDAGGGLGIDYHGSVSDFDRRLAAYASALIKAMDKQKLHLLLEPGRAIMASAGALLTRVMYIKRNGSKRFAIVDAAMNDLIRPSLYSAYHELLPAKQAVSSSTLTYDVVGPVCETGDFFARDREMQELSPGELVAVLDAGAYGMSLASNYNSRPRAAEVLIRGTRRSRIRRRETTKDLLRQEI